MITRGAQRLCAPLHLWVMIAKYVVGFAFDTLSRDHEKNVVLMRKARPLWQRGKLNGIGGHIESTDNTPTAAMVREFQEETGVATMAESWMHFCTIKGGHPVDYERQFVLYCFAAAGYDLDAIVDGGRVHSPDEPMYVISCDDLEDVIPNLNFLIPMATRSNRADWPLLIIENAGAV